MCSTLLVEDMDECQILQTSTCVLLLILTMVATVFVQRKQFTVISMSFIILLLQDCKNPSIISFTTSGLQKSFAINCWL